MVVAQADQKACSQKTVVSLLPTFQYSMSLTFLTVPLPGYVNLHASTDGWTLLYIKIGRTSL